MAWVKRPTTVDVTGGVASAVRAVLGAVWRAADQRGACWRHDPLR
jgi:hypothetical protein